MFPEEYQEDPGSPREAEKTLFVQFARQLPDEFLGPPQGFLKRIFPM